MLMVGKKARGLRRKMIDGHRSRRKFGINAVMIVRDSLKYGIRRTCGQENAKGLDRLPFKCDPSVLLLSSDLQH